MIVAFEEEEDNSAVRTVSMGENNITQSASNRLMFSGNVHEPTLSLNWVGCRSADHVRSWYRTERIKIFLGTLQ